MLRYLFAPILLVLSVVLIEAFASADSITLKSGQTHEGVITAEEDGRVQLKKAGSGVRVWFSRDQIVSLKKASAKEDPQEGDDSDGLVTDTTDPDDDVVRARELLRKMREEEEKKKRNDDKKVPSARQADQPEVTVSTNAGKQAEVDQLIKQLRDGQFYDQLDACKKLGSLGAEEAIPHLIHLMDHEKFMLRQEANRSLKKITGKNFGYRAKDSRSVRLEAVQKWEKWYKEEKKKGVDTLFKSLW